jgi:phage FluMu protein gp41
MKFMVTWRVAPEHFARAAERFLGTGSPMPEGLTMIGRWHGPGSTTGFLLVETDDLATLATHAAEWSDVLAAEVTPVLEDSEAGAALAKGKS